jgi:DUF1680 family protein
VDAWRRCYLLGLATLSRLSRDGTSKELAQVLAEKMYIRGNRSRGGASESNKQHQTLADKDGPNRVSAQRKRALDTGYLG